MRRFVQAFASSSDLPENWLAEVREAIAASPGHYNRSYYTMPTASNAEN